jgi:hypothetical protein
MHFLALSCPSSENAALLAFALPTAYSAMKHFQIIFF